MKIFWSNARYVVWSTHVNELDLTAREDVMEVRRTIKQVAEEDASLIRDTFRRKSWVQDTGTAS